MSQLHKVDLRLQRRFSLGRKAGVDGILDVFNVFNHANYGTFVTNESNKNYGQPSDHTNIAYQPRMLQLGFRTTFSQSPVGARCRVRLHPISLTA